MSYEGRHDAPMEHVVFDLGPGIGQANRTLDWRKRLWLLSSDGEHSVASSFEEDHAGSGRATLYEARPFFGPPASYGIYVDMLTGALMRSDTALRPGRCA